MTLSTGCASELPEYFGPLCEKALNDDWSPAARAGFLIHEVGHAAGMPGHVNERDRSWEGCGSYRLQLEFLAAVYYAEGSPEAFRRAAKAEFDWLMRTKFVEPSGMTLEDFEVFDDYTVE